jgi:hypothetical protein
MLALILGMAQCFFCTSDGIEASCGGEQYFSASKQPAMFEENKHLTEAVNAYYAPHLVFPPNTNDAAVACAARGSDPAWETGYKLEPWSNEEEKLEQMALASQQFSASESYPEFIPAQCSTDPLPCEMRVAWQNSFIGCPSTFIECPKPPNATKAQKEDTQGIDLSKRDNRVWYRNLDDITQERSVMSGEIWDPYKHFYARQKLTQILSEEMINRKDKYMRPIETLEQAYCFGGKLDNSK